MEEFSEVKLQYGRTWRGRDCVQERRAEVKTERKNNRET